MLRERERKKGERQEAERLISCTLHTLKENGVRRCNNSIRAAQSQSQRERRRRGGCVKDGVS